MAQPEEDLCKSVDLEIRNKRGQVVAVIPAYRTGIPGLLVHRKADEIAWMWTLSHYSGLRLGGRFESLPEALQLVSEFFRKTKVDWRVGPNELRNNVHCEIESRAFREAHSGV